MSDSRTHVANRTLDLLSARRITDIDSDNSFRAITLLQAFNDTRDEVFADHHWNVLIKRIEIAADPTAPAFEFARRFAKPVHCIKVTRLFDSFFPFVVEGKFILTDEASPINVVYTSNDVEPIDWGAQLSEAVALKLASNTALAITKKDTKRQKFLDEYNFFVEIAKTNDAQEGTPQPEVWGIDDWINSRLTGI